MTQKTSLRSKPKKKKNELVVLMGDQLFPRAKINPFKERCLFYMAEDFELCTRYKFHKKKLLLTLLAMRRYRDELEDNNFSVHYASLKDRSKKEPYEKALEKFIKKKNIKSLHIFEPADHFMQERFEKLANRTRISLKIHNNPMFLTSKERFSEYLKSSKRPFLKTFYEEQRKELKLLLTKNGGPKGGKWSFDDENRKKLPNKIAIPDAPSINPPHKLLNETVKDIDKTFSDHPGDTESFWLPTSRKEALHWLKDFHENRLNLFGPYQDALSTRSQLNFHALLSSSINLGLLTPDEVAEKTVAYYQQHKDRIRLSSVEGFIRQLIGWREFIKGIYDHFDQKQKKANFWNHKRKLKKCWYDAKTGLMPLDESIKNALSKAYCHHIERLMILGNYMVLCEIKPLDAYRWFMEMFVDSAEWVMGPNVFGMGIFSDGGVFATKPYICASNYIRKMSDYPKGDWCEVTDGLYWRFIHKHRDFYKKNPRMSMMVSMLDKKSSSDKNALFSKAEKFIDEVTTT